MSTDDPYDAWAGIEFAFPEPDWPPDEDDLRLYLPLVSGGPGLLEGSPETIVRARVGTFARTLRIDIEPAALDPDDPDADERPAPLPALGPVANLPLFDAPTAGRAPHAPEYVLAAALRLLRPGFFGLQAPVDLRGGALRVVAAEPDRAGLRGRTSIEVDLPAAREELAVALARALRATGHRAGSAKITVDEIGAPGAGKKRAHDLSLDQPLALPPPPFEWSVDHEDRSTMTLEIDFERDLDDEARAALTDRSRAFVAMLQLGLLPAAPAEDTPMGTFATSHGCAALSEACDSLPNQWTLALEDFSADLSCIHPFLESLAVLHERWKITDVTLVC